MQTHPATNASLQLSTEITEQLEEATATTTTNPGVDASGATTAAGCNESTNRRRAANHNKEFKLDIERRLRRDFPSIYVLINSTVLIICSAAIIFFERIQADHFSTADIFILSYRTFSGLALLAACVNILYALMAIISSN